MLCLFRCRERDFGGLYKNTDCKLYSIHNSAILSKMPELRVKIAVSY